MSKRKLSRFIGLVFVLAASIGGTSAYAFGAEHGTGGSYSVVDTPTATPTTSAPVVDAETYELDWH
jgi:hypothetical protein